MTRTFNRRDAFAAYDVQIKNVNWSLSGKSADERTVAVSLWQDEFRGPVGAMVYDKPDTSDWIDGPGKRDFFEHLQHALSHCGGIVRVVRSIRDRSNPTRTIDCSPATNIVMRIAHLDIEARSFRLEQTAADQRAA